MAGAAFIVDLLVGSFQGCVASSVATRVSVSSCRNGTGGQEIALQWAVPSARRMSLNIQFQQIMVR